MQGPLPEQSVSILEMGFSLSLNFFFDKFLLLCWPAVPPLVDQKPSVTRPDGKPLHLPEVTISSVPARPAASDAPAAPVCTNGPPTSGPPTSGPLTSGPPTSAASGPPAALNGGLGGPEGMDADPAAGDSRGSDSGGPDPALFEPLQEMTEGEEPLQVRRDVDSPATEGPASPAGHFRTTTERGSAFIKQMEVCRV